MNDISSRDIPRQNIPVELDGTVKVTPQLLTSLIDNQKETPVATQSKWASLKKWFVLHPKVQAAFYGVALVAALDGQGAFDGAISWPEAAHRVGDAAFVAALAYMKRSNGSTV